MKPELGVCYYPEHWPQELWADDARRMVATGIQVVRIGEFSWSRIESKPGELNFGWLDQAVETLGSAGLKIVMGTPTATPPRWMVTKHPDMLAVDACGTTRKFGSRRHYCFSHPGYLEECRRIASIFGARYGQDKSIIAWQIDNEYGCHDTTLSYSNSALKCFRSWLKDRYTTIENLNNAWGNVFWSMEYETFDDVDLPNQTVTEPNPAHVLAFRRFSSDQVVTFNKAQSDVLRELTDAPLLHNYMGRVLDFDHFAVGRDLDIASWDSYPIGFLSDRLEASAEHKQAYLRQGDPDMQAFHHDLYRAVGKGRWWVMEQQPGPVNWAPNNPAPLPGMVRLWSLEAVAHGAEVVSYFRWRQLPFGQEQMHAGLLRHDGSDAAAISEVRSARDDLDRLGQVEVAKAPVAIVFDYASYWAWATQPQGQHFDYFALCLSLYRGLRKLGLSVDFVNTEGANVDGYKIVFLPGLMTADPDLVAHLKQVDAKVVWGPRSGSKTEEFSMPHQLPTGPDCGGLDIEMVESMPASAPIPLKGGGAVRYWFEHLNTKSPIRFETLLGQPVLCGGNHLYLAGWPDEALWQRILLHLCDEAEIDVAILPKGVRIRDAVGQRFVFNYGADAVNWSGHQIEAAGVHIIETKS